MGNWEMIHSCVDGFSIVNIYSPHVYIPRFSHYPLESNPHSQINSSSSFLQKLCRWSLHWGCIVWISVDPYGQFPGGHYLPSDAAVLLRTVQKSLDGDLSSIAPPWKLEASPLPKAVAPKRLGTWGAGGTWLHHGSLHTYIQTYHLKVSWAISTFICDLDLWYIQQ